MAVPWYCSFKRTNVSLAVSHALTKAAAGVRAKALKEDPGWDANECSARSIRGLKWSEQNWIHYLAISSKLMYNHNSRIELGKERSFWQLELTRSVKINPCSLWQDIWGSSAQLVCFLDT